MAKMVLNYSHPLSDMARQELRSRFGGEIKEVMIPCQIDMDEDVEHQLLKLVDLGYKNVPAGERIRLIPPALSYAAAFVTAQFTADQDVDLIILARKGIEGYMLSTVITIYCAQ